MTVADNLAYIHDDIAEHAREAGRDPASVDLIAVSKQQSGSRIQAALDAGHRAFGENRVQEAQNHWQDRRVQYPDLRLHLLGPLQTNKVKDASALFDCIHTLDRDKLADQLAATGFDGTCLIQVNTGEESQKSGVTPDQLDDFYHYCAHDKGLTVTGLMCIPPLHESASLHFALLNKLAARIGVHELSMGMSGDYDEAITLGATYVRIGSAIFGAREG
jgi:pyridoxal phosphate enzyme (YggS family)